MHVREATEKKKKKKTLRATHENQREDRTKTGDQPRVDGEEDETVDDGVRLLPARARAVEEEDERPRDREVRDDAEHVQDLLEHEKVGELFQRLEVESVVAKMFLVRKSGNVTQRRTT